MGRTQTPEIVTVNTELSLRQNIKNILQIPIDADKKLAVFLAEAYWNKYYQESLSQIKQYAVDNAIAYSSLSELIYLIANDMTGKPRCTCDTVITTFINFNNGYNKFCSAKCRNTNPELVKQKVSAYVKTVKEKYGVDNISQLKSIKDKKSKTMLTNYGVEYNSQRPEIRRQISDMMQTKIHITKIKDGLIKSLGVSNPSLDKDVVNARRTTFDNKKIDRLIEYGILFDMDFMSYTDDYDIKYHCKKCDSDFTTNYQLLHLRKDSGRVICTVCNPTLKGTSYLEKELIDFVKSNYAGQIILNDRTLLNGKELDIYLPDIQVAIEFNGLYWHSELEKPKNYHLNKTVMCNGLGIQLIHVFEDDWIYKTHITKSRLLNKLHKSILVYARKCDIRMVDAIHTKQFLNNHHIQGWCVSDINVGLYHENELVSIMTFGNRKISSKSQFELLRFCNKINVRVAGGASKLFNYFKLNFDIDTVLSYADYSWSSGNLYKELNFKYLRNTDVNYWWVVGGLKTHRYNWRKDLLIKRNMLLPNDTEAWVLPYIRLWFPGVGVE